MRGLSLDEADQVAGAVSADGAIGVATALAIGLTLPVSAPVALCFFGGSLAASFFAYQLAQ